jgi:hypothetical protein
MKIAAHLYLSKYGQERSANHREDLNEFLIAVAIDKKQDRAEAYIRVTAYNAFTDVRFAPGSKLHTKRLPVRVRLYSKISRCFVGDYLVYIGRD